MTECFECLNLFLPVPYQICRLNLSGTDILDLESAPVLFFFFIITLIIFGQVKFCHVVNSPSKKKLNLGMNLDISFYILFRLSFFG